MTGFPWTVLAIGRTTDTTAIRRAYAERLKAMDLDRQIAEYDMLRRARDEALRLAADPAGHGRRTTSDSARSMMKRSPRPFPTITTPMTGSNGKSALPT